MKDPDPPDPPEDYLLMGDISEIDCEPEPAYSGPPPCKVTFAFRCNLAWETLQQPGLDPDERHCGTCDKYVYRCHTADELRAHQSQGHCVAFSPEVATDEGS
jgi:hypothetical protein